MREIGANPFCLNNLKTYFTASSVFSAPFLTP